MAETYEQLLVPFMFDPYADDIVDRLVDLAPQRVLEVAAGTGAVTRRLVQRLPNASIVATDMNVGMIDIGSQRVSMATWQPADGCELPFDDASFDAVVCQFGVMFFPDKVKGYAEARRVLTPGGQYVFNAWGAAEQNDLTNALITALSTVFPDDPPTFITTVPHGYFDANRVLSDLHAGGFEQTEYETVTLANTTTAEDFATGLCKGSPLRFQIEQRGDLEQSTDKIIRELTAMVGTGTVEAKLTANVFTATA